MAFVLTKPVVAGLPPGLAITVINSQPMLTLEDTTRASKILSIGEQSLIFAENQLSDLDWIRIGSANDALSGFIADFDGTLVYAEGHCENTGAASKDIHVYVNATDAGIIGNLAGGADVSFLNQTLNINFNKGDKIRLRAKDESIPIPGIIQDSVIKLSIKWRG